MDTQLATSIALCFTLPTDGSVPEWVQVIPAPDAAGRVQGKDGRYWIVRDPEALATALNAKAANIPFDINHASVLAAREGRDSAAIGWPTNFEVRDRAIWARVDWSQLGLNAISSKAYRFLSPALLYTKELEVVGLHHVGLSNHPNFETPALNSRQHDPAQPEQPQGAPSMKRIAALLGLNAEASEDAILDVLRKQADDHQVALNAAKQVDTSVYVPKTQHEELIALNAQLTEQVKGFREAEITAAVDAQVQAGKVTPAAKDFYIGMCREEGGLKKFEELMAVSPVIGDVSGLDTKTNPGMNAQQQGKPTAEEVAVCEMTGRDPATLYPDA